jgi:excisionase family DNA binding protein
MRLDSPALSVPREIAPSLSATQGGHLPQPSPSQHEEVLLTVPEVMVRLKIGRSAVYALIRSGQLPSGTIGRSRRIPADAVRRFVSDITEVAA